jgi:protein-S-isoprenylcysteine O-methyltransferase Ste14
MRETARASCKVFKPDLTNIVTRMVSLLLVARAVGGLLSVTGGAVCVYWYVFWSRNYEGELITYGPYGYVRHPFYSGFLSLALGLAVALPIFETRLLLVFTLAVLVVYVPKEEEALVRQYGQRYVDYMEKVRHRLVPGVF